MSIAGSDSSSGAGIQGDLKTFNALGVYGLSVVTAITSQNTSRFFEVEPVSPKLVKSQIRSILEDFNVDAIKIGMVYDKQTVNVIYSELEKVKIPIVLDPIFKSTTGGTLQLESAFLDFRNLLIPLSLVITPNIIEAEKISGLEIRSIRDMKNAARRIQKIGAKNVIIKGGHFLSGDKVKDILLEDERFHIYSHERIRMENHGGGCTFSAALCVNIARERKLTDAVDFARNFTLQSIRNAVKIGGGFPIIISKEHDEIENQLSHAISEFCSIKPIYQYIPECQTNFVYSVSNPKSLEDVVGLEGRIVKTGKSVTVAGKIQYGGSKHVASAVLEITQKFPSIRSCLNLKYDDKTIKRAVLRGLKISSYDRKKESEKVKKIEGNTVSWGVMEAISNLKAPPDIVFHKGDFGKEAMILIFGKTPNEVLRKISKII
jgi:hydroxymethylpyrimidine kinase/phosphomethylpyrimidine kinase